MDEENGQAGDGPETMDDLAQFLVDNPGVDDLVAGSTDDEQTSDETQKGDPDEDDDEDATADDKGDKPKSEDAEKQPSDLKFKVPVKGEDGSETTVEVDQKELIASYQRHADYTRKTMDLAEREREAFQVVTTKIEEGRTYYMQQAQMAQAAVRQLAGLRSPGEMMELARSDPSAYAFELERERQISGVLQQLDHGMQRERAQANQQTEAQRVERRTKARDVLVKDGFDEASLDKTFKAAATRYGFTSQQLANVDDPALIRMMRDAAAYQDLKDKRAEVTKKVQNAPKLPAARQAVPKNEQMNKRLNSRFQSGKAGLRDLGAWLANNPSR